MRLQLIMTVGMILTASQAYAGAWTQAQGQTQVIITASTYSARQLYTNKGRKRQQARYHKYELNPYLEYGYRDDLTLGSNLSLQRASQSASSNLGLGDSEFFLRQRLWEENGWVVSAEPLIKLPSLRSSRDDTPKLGSSFADVAMGLSTGYGFSAYGQNHFINLDSQYRHRFGSAKDQLRISASSGMRLDARWMLLPQMFFTYRTQAPTIANFTQSSADDYNQVRAQLTAVYTLKESLSLQAGGFMDVDGKNAGRGKGVLLALWTRW